MKKLFTSFISLMTIGAFSQCGFNSNNKTEPSSSVSDKQKTEKKEKQVETKTTSSSSSLGVKSSTRNQYLRKSHEEWIANSLSEMKSKLKDDPKYKAAFNTWKSSDDGDKAKTNAYSKSDGFKQAFARWKANRDSRTDQNFVDQIAKNQIVDQETASYKIYMAWTKSVEGKKEMKDLYVDGSPLYNRHYPVWSRTWENQDEDDYATSSASSAPFQLWSKSINAKDDLKATYEADGSYYQDGYDDWSALPENQKTSDEYASSPESDIAFEVWAKSPGGLQILSPIFERTQKYRDKYRDWSTNDDAQINRYIENSYSDTNYDFWRQNSGVNELKTLWERTTTTSDSFEEKVKYWDGRGNTNNDLGKLETYRDEQIPNYGSAPEADAKAWIDTDAAIELFNRYLNRQYGNVLNPALTNAQVKAKLKEANPTNLAGAISNSNIRAVLKTAFSYALGRPDLHPQLATLYLKWRKNKYKDSDNQINYDRDLNLWTYDKKTLGDSDVKSKFKAAIKTNPSPEKSKFETWKTTNITETIYSNSNTFIEDLVEWAKEQKTAGSLTLKVIIAGSIDTGTSSDDATLRGKYDLWKIKDEDAYKRTEAYREDISKWAIIKRNEGNAEVERLFKAAMTSSDANGDNDLRIEFEKWKTADHAKYKLSQDYIRNFAIYLIEGRVEVNVKEKIKDIITSDAPVGIGNQNLKKAFEAWAPTSKENFVKSEAINSEFKTWSNSLNDDDLAILNEITKILQDKNLFTSSTGNSQLIKVLKEITKDSYDSYILTL